MKIRRRGRRVSVLVGAGELSELGLSFEDFREKKVSALIFLAAVRAHLSADGEGEVRGGIRISRYCGGVIRMVPAEQIYGMTAAKRLGLVGENIYQCQNCNARVGCHKGTTRPLGDVANETLRRCGCGKSLQAHKKNKGRCSQEGGGEVRSKGQ